MAQLVEAAKTPTPERVPDQADAEEIPASSGFVVNHEFSVDPDAQGSEERRVIASVHSRKASRPR